MINFIIGFCVTHTALTLLGNNVGPIVAAIIAVGFSVVVFSALREEKANAVKAALEEKK